MCTLGLVRIWFGSDAKHVKSDNRYYQLALRILNQIAYELFVPPFSELTSSYIKIKPRTTKRKLDTDTDDEEEQILVENPCSYTRMLGLSETFAARIFE